MKKMVCLIIGLLIFSIFVSAQAVEDQRYGLLQASKYSNESKVIMTENRIGVVESVDPQTGEILLSSRKDAGGIKSKDEFNIQTPITVKKPLKGELERTSLGQKAVVNQQAKVTQPQALQQIKKSDLLKATGHVSKQINVDTFIKNLFIRILSFLRN